MRDTIYRQDAVMEIANHLGIPAENWMKIAEEWLRDVPSAQTEEIALHESCTDCPLYDKNRHNCPRFNKVIPETLRELQSAQPDYTELKREFILMASYIDVLLECSDEQKETLIGFISRLSEYMPWTGRD